MVAPTNHRCMPQVAHTGFLIDEAESNQQMTEVCRKVKEKPSNPRLTEEQKEIRIRGLGILVRMIARAHFEGRLSPLVEEDDEGPDDLNSSAELDETYGTIEAGS